MPAESEKEKDRNNDGGNDPDESEEPPDEMGPPLNSDRRLRRPRMFGGDDDL